MDNGGRVSVFASDYRRGRIPTKLIPLSGVFEADALIYRGGWERSTNREWIIRGIMGFYRHQAILGKKLPAAG